MKRGERGRRSDEIIYIKSLIPLDTHIFLSPLLRVSRFMLNFSLFLFLFLSLDFEMLCSEQKQPSRISKAAAPVAGEVPGEIR